MIKLYKSGRYSIYLEFDKEGARTLADIFQCAVKNNTSMLMVDEIELGLPKKNDSNNLTVVSSDQEDKLINVDNGAILELDKYILEYAVQRLCGCKDGKEFYPAELCELDFKNINYTIYGFLKE